MVSPPSTIDIDPKEDRCSHTLSSPLCLQVMFLTFLPGLAFSLMALRLVMVAGIILNATG